MFLMHGQQRQLSSVDDICTTAQPLETPVFRLDHRRQTSTRSHFQAIRPDLLLYAVFPSVGATLLISRR